jgi:hypothetical protein
MFGHGTYIYNPKLTMQAYGGAAGVADRCRHLGMQHAWLRVHNKNGAWLKAENSELAAALRAAGISVGVWGWNDGNDVDRDIANAKDAIDYYSPDLYIADIEQGVEGASWTVAGVGKFLGKVKEHLGAKPLVVSSFGYIKAHAPELMRAADPIADFFAPQVYWFWHPKQDMLPAGDPILGGLPTNNPAAYATVCLTEWRRVVTKPLILTGQAYWGEASGWSQSIAEQKLASFLQGFSDYQGIVGLNWWHLGGGKAMSATMQNAIRNAGLGSQSYGSAPGTQMASATANSLFAAPTVSGAATELIVAAEELYFRSSPQGGTEANLLGAFDYGHRVRAIGQELANGFIQVEAQLGGVLIQGYLLARYLRAVEAPEIERAVSEAIDEWLRFDKGVGQEHREPYSSYINQMWTARGLPHITGRDREQYWSAAFISFVLENAGYLRTKFAIQHSVYIHEAIQNRFTQANRDFWAYRLSEAKPQVGDIVCGWREYRTTYEEAETDSSFPSHTDIVIGVRDRSIITIGGNVSQSVETKTMALSEQGYLLPGETYFAVMKNRFRAPAQQLIG